MHHFQMQRVDRHLSKYDVLFTYSKLSLLDSNVFDDIWRICYIYLSLTVTVTLQTVFR